MKQGVLIWYFVLLTQALLFSNCLEEIAREVSNTAGKHKKKKTLSQELKTLVEGETTQEISLAMNSIFRTDKLWSPVNFHLNYKELYSDGNVEENQNSVYI